MLYEEVLQALRQNSERTNITDKPASDYYFVPDQYPLPVNTPDLEAQVGQFLSLQPPALVPRQTLWVFTFGTWDVWNLAVLPRSSGEKLIDYLATHLFSQIDRLYEQSLNPESPVYSDITANATQAEDGVSTKRKTAGNGDSFNVVLPELFDITLTPGWQTRPVAPMPHSKAEHMRNAAALTSRWNTKLRAKLDAWEQKGTSSPVGEVKTGVKVARADIRTRSYNAAQEKPPGASPVQEEVQGEGKVAPQGESQDEDQTKDQKENQDGIYPRRKGILSNPTMVVLNAMTEGELQRSGLKDSKGRGSLSHNDTMMFPDVWNACLDSHEGAGSCDLPNDHLFYDAFRIGRLATEEVGQVIARDVLLRLFTKA